jgi:ribosome biogenesis GTPase / thiamine phosphate phosphatase
MNAPGCGLGDWGWSDWFEQRAKDQLGLAPARVAAVDRELLLVVDQAGPFRAHLAGSYLHHHPLVQERPCVGDWVVQIRAAGITEPILTLSNLTDSGVEELRRQLLPGKTYCVVGSSGVGKSTLINRLVGQETLDTAAVSATGEGRHTTVRRELIRLAGGALVIDNPGMREFGILDAEDGLLTSYKDIARLAPGCRYRDCRHSNEPGCAVLAAVRTGAINREHYDNFLKLRTESEFHELSYAEKRKKDRDFGRFLKLAKKDLYDD